MEARRVPRFSQRFPLSGNILTMMLPIANRHANKGNKI